MPYPTEHAARIRKPDYPSYARKVIAPGISIILGIKGGKSETQAYRFDKEKFSPEDAQKWLADHKEHPISFEPAKDTLTDGADEDYKIYGGKIPAWSKDDATNNQINPRLPSSPAVPISDSPGLDGASEPSTRRVPDINPQQVGDSGKMPADPAIDRPDSPPSVGHEAQMPISPLLTPAPNDAGKGRQTMPDPVKRNPTDPGPFQAYKYDTAEIKGIEILREGIWNKTKVTIKDMEEMVAHFKEKILEPFLNLDHDDKFTDKVKRTLKIASLGYVSDLWIDGKKLMANFKQVPVKIAELIKGGALKKRSVEFYTRDYEQNGRKFDNVLRAVSFFGADVPAVNALSDDFAVLMTRDATEPKGTIAKITIKENIMEIKQEDYETLVNFKARSEALSAEAETLKLQATKISAEKTKIEAEMVALKKFKDDQEAADEAAGDKEHEDFIQKHVEAGKIHPEHAPMFKSCMKHLKATNPEHLKHFIAHFEKKAEMKLAAFTQIPEPGSVNTITENPKNTAEAHQRVVKFCQEKGWSVTNTDNYNKAMVELGLVSVE